MKPLCLLLLTIACIFSNAGHASCDADYNKISSTPKIPKEQSEDITQAVNGALKEDIFLTGKQIPEYMAQARAMNTAEVIWFPHSHVRGMEGSGHVGIRVGNKMFHMKPGGIEEGDFTSYMEKRIGKGHGGFGYAFEVNAQERQALDKYFEQHKTTPFNPILRNCSQTVCRSIESAGIAKFNQAVQFDPAFTAFAAKRLARPGHRTVYANPGANPKEFDRENLKFRLQAAGVIIGVPVVTGTAITSAIYVHNLLNAAEER